ncbi:hypothetical protein GCM10027341_15590 [Spirosoma knui]
MATNKLTDQQIQELLDSQRHAPTSVRSQADDEAVDTYRALFDELSTEPAYDLSYAFSANVVRQIQQQTIARIERKAMVLYGLCSLGLVGCAASLVFFVDQESLVLLKQLLVRFWLPLLLTGGGLSLIQWLDYRFVKAKRG